MEQATTISVYVIQNIHTLDVYVGQTTQPDKRWRNHRSLARTLGKRARRVHRAMHAIGIENFQFTVIEKHTTQADADDAESFWIEFFRANQDGYNVADGGVNMQKAYKGKHFSPATEFKPGHVMSEATCAKISATAKERCIRPPSRLGAKCSEETRMRMAMARARFSPEDVSCIREAVQSGKCTQSALAKRYGVGTTAISDIVAGRSYSYVSSTPSAQAH